MASNVFYDFLNEIKNLRFRKFVQTVTTLPNFISWVLVYSVAFLLMSNNGMFNSFAMDIGLIDTPIDFLKSNQHIWFKMWLWLTWKNLGWAAIMYIAAISSIDTELFEAARVDGASRLRIIRHIPPSLLPTFLYFYFLIYQIF